MTYQTFQKGLAQGLPAVEYPVTRARARGPHNAGLVSVRNGEHHGIQMPAALCNDAARKRALQEVLDVRDDVNSDQFPRAFMERYYPEDWGSFPSEIPELLAWEGLSFDNPKGLANVVHMDDPTDLGRAMRNWLMAQKGCEPKHLENKSGMDFVNVVAGTIAGVASAAKEGLDHVFEVKWYYGVPRPEELAGKNITAYAEGCPNHPSFPAGHGAAAFHTLIYFLKEWTLTGEAKRALFASAYIWAMARTMAGVHYAVDNLVYAPRWADYA